MANLTDIVTVKSYLGLDDAGLPPAAVAARDAVLTRLVAAASAFIRASTGCDFEAGQAYTDILNGDESRAVQLAHAPVTAVSSVRVDGVAILPASDTAEGFIFDAGGFVQLVGPTAASEVTSLLFTLGRGNVVISYVAGQVPEDIVQACVELVAAYWSRRQRIGLASQTVGGEVMAYQSAPVPTSVEATLALHRVISL